jgi:hypothetical protein
MRTRSDFEKHQDINRSGLNKAIPRSSPPLHQLPTPPRHVCSPFQQLASPFHYRAASPLRSPQSTYIAPVSPFQPVRHGSPHHTLRLISPQKYFLSPGHFPLIPPGSGRKRARSESPVSKSGSSSCSSDLEYSSESDGHDQSDAPPRYHDQNKALSKPPSPPKYFKSQLADEEDIDSSDSDYEDEDDASTASLEDLRDFIDFDPKFNRSNISKRVRSNFGSRGDELEDFLFQGSSKPRKWFKALAWNAVGAKLSRPNTPSRSATSVEVKRKNAN